MALGWMDVSELPFNALLLLERVQLTWLPGWIAEGAGREELAMALAANPAVSWFIRRKCPEVAPWVDELLLSTAGTADAQRVRAAEVAVLRAIEDLLVYALDPSVYDAQPFLGWDSEELLALVDLAGRTVLDVGSGTGRLALVAAEAGAKHVFAVEPVANLRRYLLQKARARGLANVHPADGIITDIPFPDGHADVTLAGHVFGDDPPAELRELSRVTRGDGMVILCPGNNDVDNDAHAFLVEQGFSWSRFEEPSDGTKRKYWRRERG